MCSNTTWSNFYNFSFLISFTTFSWFLLSIPPKTKPGTTSRPQNTASTNTGGSSGSGMFNQMQGFQQMIQSNPEMMQNMLNNPMVQNMMNNPELIRNLIMNNPEMRQLLQQNPEVGQLLNDPSYLRQTMDLARNPNLLRELMRNTDRAMSNIEAHPEGFNILRQMYSNVQEPMMNASQQSIQSMFGGTNSPSQQAPPISSETPNDQALPNPWNPSSTPSPINAGSSLFVSFVKTDEFGF